MSSPNASPGLRPQRPTRPASQWADVHPGGRPGLRRLPPHGRAWLLTLLLATAGCGGATADAGRDPHGANDPTDPGANMSDRGWATPDLIKLARGTSSALDAKLAAGDTAWEHGDPTRAELEYSRAAELGPNDPAPLVGLARARLARAGVPEGVNSAPEDPTLRAAIDLLQRAVMLDERYAPARLELGRALLVAGNAEEALKQLRSAVQQAPESAEAHSAAGLAELALGNIPEALHALDRAAVIDPSRAARHLNLGSVRLMAGQTAEAITSFERAVALEPDNAQAMSSLGAALLATGKPADALSILVRAVEAAPEVGAHRANLAQALQLSGQLERAVEEYQRAVRLDPELTSGWLNLGNVLAELGRWDDARQAHDRARALEPDDPTVRAAIEDRERLQAERTAKPEPTKPGAAR